MAFEGQPPDEEAETDAPLGAGPLRDSGAIARLRDSGAIAPLRDSGAIAKLLHPFATAGLLGAPLEQESFGEAISPAYRKKQR